MSAAARHIGISQPALSQSITLLEKSVGERLFHRTVHGVQLTVPGHVLLPHAHRIVREYEAAHAALGARHHELSGQIIIAAPAAFARSPLASLIGGFRAIHPGVRFRVHKPTLSATVRQLLRTGAVDLALSPDHHENSPYDERLVFETEMWALLPPGSTPQESMSLDELLLLPMVLSSPGSATRFVLEEAAGAQRVSRAHIAVETEHPGSLVPLVSRGVGWALVLRDEAIAAQSRGAVAIAIDPPIFQHAFLVSHRHATGASRVFVDFATDPPSGPRQPS